MKKELKELKERVSKLGFTIDLRVDKYAPNHVGLSPIMSYEKASVIVDQVLAMLEEGNAQIKLNRKMELQSLETTALVDYLENRFSCINKIMSFLINTIVEDKGLQDIHSELYGTFKKIECDIEESWAMDEDFEVGNYYQGEKPDLPTDAFARDWLQNEDEDRFVGIADYLEERGSLK